MKKYEEDHNPRLCFLPAENNDWILRLFLYKYPKQSAKIVVNN